MYQFPQAERHRSLRGDGFAQGPVERHESRQGGIGRVQDDDALRGGRIAAPALGPAVAGRERRCQHHERHDARRGRCLESMQPQPRSGKAQPVPRCQKV